MNTTTDSDVLYSLDLASGSLTWSESLHAAFGYSTAEQVNSVEWWTDHIHPDDTMLLNQTMDKLEDPQVADWTVSYRFRKGDNSYILVTDHASVLRADDGRAVRLTGQLTYPQE